MFGRLIWRDVEAIPFLNPIHFKILSLVCADFLLLKGSSKEGSERMTLSKEQFNAMHFPVFNTIPSPLFPHHWCLQGQHTTSLCVHSDIRDWSIHYPKGMFHLCLKVSSSMKLSILSHCKEKRMGLYDLPEEGCWSEWDPLSLSEIRSPCLFTNPFILVKLWMILSCLEDKLKCASLVSSSPSLPAHPAITSLSLSH